LKSNLSEEEVDEFEQKGASLCRAIEGSDSYNKAFLEPLECRGTPTTLYRNFIFDASVSESQPQKFAEGGRVKLTCNLWLASDQTGTVVGVLYGENVKIGIDTPEVILLK